MILTCPRCAARYAVDSDQIRSGGRTVRCVSCGNKWQARPEDGEPEPLEAPRAAPAPKPSPEPPPESPPTEPEPPLAEEAFPNVDPVIPALTATRKPPRRTGPPAPLVWAGLAAILALIALCLALFRNEVVRLWPKTAALYAATGMSVNGVGLLIENVRLAPAVQNGQAVLGVSGRIRNERDHPTPAAPLQVTLYDSSGAELARLVAKPVDAIPPLESRYFSVLVRNPPPGVAGVALAFVSHPPEHKAEAGKAKGPAAAGAHEAPASHTPAAPAVQGHSPAAPAAVAHAPEAPKAAPAAPAHD
jgi:predicted Zn finger-like uncharacterized protein